MEFGSYTFSVLLTVYDISGSIPGVPCVEIMCSQSMLFVDPSTTAYRSRIHLKDMRVLNQGIGTGGNSCYVDIDSITIRLTEYCYPWTLGKDGVEILEPFSCWAARSFHYFDTQKSMAAAVVTITF
jgi:hypothetical protein